MARKSLSYESFNPRRRFERAMAACRHNDREGITDIWTNKIIDMIQLRAKFDEEYKSRGREKFADRYPLYASLLQAAEDTTIGGDRDQLEAVLLSSANVQQLAEQWQHPQFDALFLGAYRTMFYDVLGVFKSPALMYKFVIAPMACQDTNKLAVGSIWKILALSGGFSLLNRKGFGTAAIKAADIEYLLQLASYRHCSTLLQYTSAGLEFFEDNPTAAVAINALTEFDSIRSGTRRPDYLAELDSTEKNNLSTLLSSELKLLSLSDEDILPLVELDGGFRIDKENTIEYTKHVNFLDNEGHQDE